MRKLSLFLLFLGYFLFAGCASATTYYISYSSGSNANNGTSQSTPWKTHPYMQTRSSCTGTGNAPAYSHSAGDQFVFKQGDSWPNACFDMVIQDGGASGNPDVYTYDPTWGTPGGTTGNVGQAVGVYEWTAGGSVINGADGFNRFVINNGNNYITFNGFALNGFQAPGTGSFGNDEGFDIQSSSNVIWSNCYVHGWTHNGASSDSIMWFVGHDGGSSANNVGARLTGCVIDGAGPGSNGGAVTWKIPISDNNIIKNIPNGFLTGANASIHDNIIGPMTTDFDSGNHLNCIEPITFISGGTSTNYIYNNVFFGCQEAAILAQGVGGNGSEVDYLWNNVGYLGSASQIPAAIFQFSSYETGSNSAIFAFNNTAYAGSSIPCFRTLSQGGPKFATLTLQNNFCISDNGFIDNGDPGNSGTISNNVTLTVAQAAAQGYTSSGTYAYAPTSKTSATAGAGTSLAGLASGALATLINDTTYGGTRTTQSRASGTWDAGAFQFGGAGSSGTPTPPTNVKVLSVQ